MVRKNGGGGKGNPDKLFNDGLRKLADGFPASPWICRELLSLAPEPTLMEVVKALHSQLHVWLRNAEEGNTVVRASIRAAAVLLAYIPSK